MLVLHALGLLAVAAALALGLWQYGAWQTARDVQVRDVTAEPVRPLDDVLGPDAVFTNDQQAQPVRVTGRWLPRATVWVEDRSQGGRVGRWLVTPVAVCAEDASARSCREASAVPVVRGWTEATGSAGGSPEEDTEDGTESDAPTAPSGRVTVEGWLQPGEGSGQPDPDPTDDVLPELRIASLVQRVEQDLYGGYVIGRDLPASATRGLEPVAPPQPIPPGPFTALRNLLYAVQWWVFGAFAVVVWQRWVRDRLAVHASATAGIPSQV